MSKNNVAKLEDPKINIKIKLSVLWVTIMFFYIYADILSLFKPGQIGEVIEGKMGPFEVSQLTLVMASAVVIIPTIMVLLSLILKPIVNRWTNIIIGTLFTLVAISNLIGVSWAYYILFGILEIMVTVLIVWSAWKWPVANQAK